MREPLAVVRISERTTLGLLLALTLLPFLWLALQGRTFIAGDSSSFEYPYLEFLRSTLYSGRWEPWNPYLAGGCQTMVATLGRTFYPGNLFFACFDPLDSMVWFFCLHQLVAAGGGWLYLRSHRLSPLACFVGALTFAFSAARVQTAGNVIFFPILTAAPWLLYWLESLCRQPSWRACLALTVLVAALLHGGGWQITAIFFLFLASYTVLLGRRTGSWRRPVWWLQLAAAAVLSLCFLTPVLFSMRKAQEAGASRAIGFSAQLAGRNALSWPGLAVAAYPPFFGGLEEGTEKTQVHLHEHIYHLALPLLPLAWLGLRPGRRHRWWVRCWVALAVPATLLAFGFANPVYAWLHAKLPFFANFRVPVRWLSIFPLVAMIVVAVGTDRWLLWQRRPRGPRWQVLSLLGLVYVAYLAWGKVDWLAAHGLLVLSLAVALGLLRGRWSSSSALGWLLAGVALECSAPWMWVQSSYFVPSAYLRQHLGLLRQVRSQLPDPGLRVLYLPQPELPQMLKMANVGSWNPLVSSDYVRYLFVALNGREVEPEEFQQLMYQNFAPTAMFRSGPEARQNALYYMLAPGCLVTPQQVMFEPIPLGRLWFAGRAELCVDRAEARRRMLQPGYDPREVLWVEELPTRAPPLRAGKPHMVLQPSQVVIDLNGQTGWLTLADNYFPGWQALVDGKPRPIHRANTIFRALPVYPGEQQVVLRYVADEMQRSQPWLWLGVLGLGALLAQAWREARQGAST
jgi:hypothetical protein